MLSYLEKSSFNDAFLALVLSVPSLILLSAENVGGDGEETEQVKKIL